MQHVSFVLALAAVVTQPAIIETWQRNNCPLLGPRERPTCLQTEAIRWDTSEGVKHSTKLKYHHQGKAARDSDFREITHIFGQSNISAESRKRLPTTVPTQFARVRASAEKDGGTGC